MTTFNDRIRAVIGQQATHAWASEHNLKPAKVWEWFAKGRTPREAGMKELAEKTGIPLSWWMHGDLPPPEPRVVALVAHETRQNYGASADIDTDLLQQVIDVFFAWQHDNGNRVRIDRSKYGAVIAVLYRMALKSGGAVKQELEQVLALVA